LKSQRAAPVELLQRLRRRDGLALDLADRAPLLAKTRMLGFELQAGLLVLLLQPLQLLIEAGLHRAGGTANQREGEEEWKRPQS
jgi:hypothetical protein